MLYHRFWLISVCAYSNKFKIIYVLISQYMGLLVSKNKHAPMGS